MYKIYRQDVREKIDNGMFHAVLCDPPYELGFMGKGWDRSGVSFQPETWALIAEYMHPGAHLFAFGGTRTFHRLACAVEDAGLEIRDCKCYIYGSGYPKSLDVSKAIDKAAGAEREVVGPGINAVRKARHHAKRNGVSDGTTYFGAPDAPVITAPTTDAAKTFSGYGTGIKPAWEPIVIARKPLIGTVAENCLRYGCGAINVDGGRIGTTVETWPKSRSYGSDGTEASWTTGSKGKKETQSTGKAPAGRWPANLLHDGSAEVVRMFPVTASKNPCGKRNATTGFSSGITPGAAYVTGYGDSGPAVRFFYQVDARIDAADPIWYGAKASQSERNAGLDSLPIKELRAYGDFKGTAEHAPKMNVKARNDHPTVKPIDLCRYLAMLMLPPKEFSPRRLLVPFSGSGSEMIGALLAGWDEVIGIELDEHYCDIAEKRIEYYTKQVKINLF